MLFGKPPVARSRDGGFHRFYKAAFFAAIISFLVPLAGTVHASALSFSYGLSMVKWNNPTGVISNHPINIGRSMLVSWNPGNDLSMGFYTESDWDPMAAGFTYETIVNAIQISKGIVKYVSLGVNIGEMDPDGWLNYQPVVDVFGAVDLLSGTGGKINSAVKATVGARFSNKYNDADALIMGLAISVGF